MTLNRSTTRAIAAAWAAAACCATPAHAQPVGPGGHHDPAPVAEPVDGPAGNRGDAGVWIPPATEAMPLGLPESQPDAALPDDHADSKSLPAGTLRTAVSLGGVLMLIFALAWGFKRVARLSGGLAGQVGAGGRAPAGLVEVLARYPMGARQTLVVIRFDRRVLLCSMAGGGRSGAASMTTLCELDQPEDVASVLVKARDESGDSIARSFERAIEAESERFDGPQDGRRPVKVRVPAGYAEAQSSTGAGRLERGVATLLGGGRRA